MPLSSSSASARMDLCRYAYPPTPNIPVTATRLRRKGRNCTREPGRDAVKIVDSGCTRGRPQVGKDGLQAFETDLMQRCGSMMSRLCTVREGAEGLRDANQAGVPGVKLRSMHSTAGIVIGREIAFTRVPLTSIFRKGPVVAIPYMCCFDYPLASKACGKTFCKEARARRLRTWEEV